MKTLLFPSLLSLIFLFNLSTHAQITLDSIPDGSGYTYIASPEGQGPFPAVLYNHGGKGTIVGGDLRGTVIALAKEGFIARAEKRKETVSISGHLEEVTAALDVLRADTRTDTNCVNILGFSRGGYLTLEAGKQNPNKVHNIIAMAPANPNNLLLTLLTDVSPINDPVLNLVATNDTFQDDHVTLAQTTYDSLTAGGKTIFLTIYPGYDSNSDSMVNSSDDGHELFFVVQNPYWTDVLNFLKSSNCYPTGLKNLDGKTEKFKIYPNPSNHKITIEFNTFLNETSTVTLYNSLGDIIWVKSGNISKKLEIDSHNLKPGLYFFQILNGNQIKVSGKLIIENK